MQEIIQKANADPKAFYENYFSDANKAKIQELSRSLSTAPTMARKPATSK
jgi:hypothetical protein